MTMTKHTEALSALRDRINSEAETPGQASLLHGFLWWVDRALGLINDLEDEIEDKAESSTVKALDEKFDDVFKTLHDHGNAISGRVSTADVRQTVEAILKPKLGDMNSGDWRIRGNRLSGVERKVDALEKAKSEPEILHGAARIRERLTELEGVFNAADSAALFAQLPKRITDIEEKLGELADDVRTEDDTHAKIFENLTDKEERLVTLEDEMKEKVHASVVNKLSKRLRTAENDVDDKADEGLVETLEERFNNNTRKTDKRLVDLELYKKNQAEANAGTVRRFIALETDVKECDADSRLTYLESGDNETSRIDGVQNTFDRDLKEHEKRLDALEATCPGDFAKRIRSLENYVDDSFDGRLDEFNVRLAAFEAGSLGVNVEAEFMKEAAEQVGRDQVEIEREFAHAVYKCEECGERSNDPRDVCECDAPVAKSAKKCQRCGSIRNLTETRGLGKVGLFCIDSDGCHARRENAKTTAEREADARVERDRLIESASERRWANRLNLAETKLRIARNTIDRLKKAPVKETASSQREDRLMALGAESERRDVLDAIDAEIKEATDALNDDERNVFGKIEALVMIPLFEGLRSTIEKGKRRKDRDGK
jgi:hypothetical protein